MNAFRLAACAAFAILVTPVWAADGLLESCDAGQSFARGDITVSGAYTRAMLPRAAAAGGYLTIANSGAAADRLESAASAAAARVEVHEMRLEGDVMKMTPVEGGLDIPAGGSVALMPGGYHLMFMGIGTPFAEGQCVLVTLHFATAGALDIALAVGGVAQDAPVMAHDMDDMDGMDHGMDHDPDGQAMPAM
jgi:copper(I)-binding protein